MAFEPRSLSALRIPMWGYEAKMTDACANKQKVTNPHVGL